MVDSCTHLFRNIRLAREYACQNNYETATILLSGLDFDPLLASVTSAEERNQLLEVQKLVKAELKQVGELIYQLDAFHTGPTPKRPSGGYAGPDQAPQSYEDESSSHTDPQTEDSDYGFDDRRRKTTGPRFRGQRPFEHHNNAGWGDQKPQWDNSPATSSWDDSAPPPQPPVPIPMPTRRGPTAGSRDRAKNFMENGPRPRATLSKRETKPRESVSSAPKDTVTKGRDQSNRKPQVPRLSRQNQQSEEKNKGPNGMAKFVGSSKEEQELVTSMHRDIIESGVSMTWDKIAGLADAKDLLEEAVILPLVLPHVFKGIRRPWSGVLMYGPPGTGKTMLAKAVANQCQTTFFNVSTANLTSKWRGDSEKMVRLLFDMARYYAPSTIFIDEIDSLGSQRGEGAEHEASRRVKTELLIQMDGLSGDEAEGKNVMVLGATNHPWDLDDAMRRRLEKRIHIPLPEKADREQLFKINLSDLTVADDVNIEFLAEATKGYSGHDITCLCRDASMMKLRSIVKNAGGVANLQKLGQQSDLQLPVSQNDFTSALQKCPSSVSKLALERYKKWDAEFGASV